CSGKSEPAAFERAAAHHAAFGLGDGVDGSPADVPAARTIGVGLPQRIRRQLSVTSAAEALDNERLHGLIFAEPARSASPDWGRGAPTSARPRRASPRRAARPRSGA